MQHSTLNTVTRYPVIQPTAQSHRRPILTPYIAIRRHTLLLVLPPLHDTHKKKVETTLHILFSSNSPSRTSARTMSAASSGSFFATCAGARHGFFATTRGGARTRGSALCSCRVANIALPAHRHFSPITLRGLLVAHCLAQNTRACSLVGTAVVKVNSYHVRYLRYDGARHVASNVALDNRYLRPWRLSPAEINRLVVCLPASCVACLSYVRVSRGACTASLVQL